MAVNNDQSVIRLQCIEQRKTFGAPGVALTVRGAGCKNTAILPVVSFSVAVQESSSWRQCAVCFAGAHPGEIGFQRFAPRQQKRTG